MFKANLSNAVVSKGYDGADAVQFHTNEAGEISVAAFNVFTQVYDKSAENNQRYLTVPCRAFGKTAEKISKMKLGEYGNVNIDGRLDENQWTDKEGKKHRSLYIIVDAIEYNGARKKSDGGDGATTAPAAKAEAPAAPADAGEEAFDDLPF